MHKMWAHFPLVVIVHHEAEEVDRKLWSWMTEKTPDWARPQALHQTMLDHLLSMFWVQSQFSDDPCASQDSDQYTAESQA